MIFASTTKLFKILIKNIKQHLKNFQWLSVSPIDQDISNYTTNLISCLCPFKMLLATVHVATYSRSINIAHSESFLHLALNGEGYEIRMG